MTEAEKLIREPFVLRVDTNRDTRFNADEINEVLRKTYDFTNYTKKEVHFARDSQRPKGP